MEAQKYSQSNRIDRCEPISINPAMTGRASIKLYKQGIFKANLS